MIQRKTNREIQLMKEAGELLAACHKELRALIKPGVTTLQLDSFVEDFLEEHGATPEQKGYQDYPFATCASVNDVICHGFPNDKKLEEGDIVTVDMVVNLNGALADSAWSYAVGKVSDEKQLLLDTTKKSLYVGIEQAVIGNRIGDIGHAIQQYAEGEGFAVVRDFTGHGIGPTLHEEPMIPHFGQPGTGIRLKEGMVITIEPMLNTGVPYSKIDEDGWTARTMDGSLSAQYEHTIAITSEGPVILTSQDDE
ncbi:type I methionyl aminopeptidase [Guptibacillus algicola]|uniref:type I methionyl aminopeptidase n=1 Tax=Guptibacillus algicola TaxID=225844 RepID=UPI001CD453A8|nr:type I methionyl aminopeptidase [Alkalihalobacillus algicola]MCA0986816.1 type I methionyl aminopeptidase [Alkalihalobacillus algicola]